LIKANRRKETNMTIRTYSALMIVALCAVTLRAAGQAQEKPKTDDLNAPGEEHRKLDSLAGSWDVTVKFPVGPGRTMEGKSACEAKWVMDGRFLRQEYSSTFAGKPLTVVRYLGFDRHRGRFIEIQFESTHTDVMRNEGTISNDGKTITCEGTHIDAAASKEAKVRSVTTIADKDAFTVEMFYTVGEQTKIITLTHKRKK
jgi:hypothetical protein